MRHRNHKHGYKSNLEIGKTVISKEFPSNMDGFWFSVNEGMIINSFDFVSVENLCNSRTVGIVKELQSIQTDNLRLLEKTKQKDITVAKVAVMGNTGGIRRNERERLNKHASKTTQISKSGKY